MISFFQYYSQNFCAFFIPCPILYYAICGIFGIHAGLFQNEGFLIIGCLFTLPYFFSKHWQKGLIGIGLIFFSLLYHSNEHIRPSQIPEKGIEGYAWIEIHQLQKTSEEKYCYSGIIKSFWGKVAIKNIPFMLFLPNQSPRYLADRDYLIKGSFLPTKSCKLQIRTSAASDWKRLDRISYAEWRYQTKHVMKNLIDQCFLSIPTQQFLAGLLIGEFNDLELKQVFSRFGLLHILAISGFHFSLIASLLSFIFLLIFPARIVGMILIIVLSFYFFILGWGPSIIRAWMTITLFYTGFLLNRRSQSLNNMGIAILVSSQIDPFIIYNLGYQFSVFCTAAILLFNGPILMKIDEIFPKRKYAEIMNWPFLNQFAYLILGFLKQGASLSLSTSIVALPLSLYYFQFFPILTLFYNLFFPFLVSISMTLLLLGLFISPLPLFYEYVNHMNDYFTCWILNLTYCVPETWDIYLRTQKFNYKWLLFLFNLIFLLLIYFQKSNKHVQFNPKQTD